MDCKKFKQWGDLTRDERLEVMREILVRMAVDYDLPLPGLVLGPPPDNPLTPDNESDLPAGYDPASNTIFFNRLSDWTFNDDPTALLHSAGHEFAHVMFTADAADSYDLSTDQGRTDFLKDAEEYADEYADELADEIDEYCKNPPPPQSPGTSDTGPGDWNMPAETVA